MKRKERSSSEELNHSKSDISSMREEESLWWGFVLKITSFLGCDEQKPSPPVFIHSQTSFHIFEKITCPNPDWMTLICQTEVVFHIVHSDLHWPGRRLAVELQQRSPSLLFSVCLKQTVTGNGCVDGVWDTTDHLNCSDEAASGYQPNPQPKSAHPLWGGWASSPQSRICGSEVLLKNFFTAYQGN